jgi:glycogen operon protein
MPKAVVIDPAFDWMATSHRDAVNNSIIYEVHVKGFTRLCPDVPAELRGHVRGDSGARQRSSI